MTLELPAKTLLIIDDDSDILYLLQTALSLTTGWTVFTAASGHAGLRLAQTEPLDAILLDGQMPMMNGVETLRRLRQHPYTEAIPVVFITASPALLSPFPCHDVGVKGIVPKPFDLDTLAIELTQTFGWSR